MNASDPSPSRILVTGGTGLLGSRLVRDLAATGKYDVVVLSRDPSGDLPPGARFARWDGDTTDGWGHLADGALGIVHLAGESVADGRWTDDKKRRIRASRIDSTRAVTEAVAAAEERPRFLVQASAVGYYGDRGDELVTESSAPGNDFLAEVAQVWEDASDGAEALGVRRVLLRTGVVLSADGGALPKMAMPFKLGAGGPLGSGRQYVPWIHVDDHVRAMRFLIEHPDASGPFNLTAPHPVRNRELADGLGRVLRRPSLLPAPKVALHLVLGEMSDMLLHGQRAIPRALNDLGFDFRFTEIEPALRDLL